MSKITGGKFANGAVTGAFVYMYNHALHEAKMDARYAQSAGIEGEIVNPSGKEKGWYFQTKDGHIYNSPRLARSLSKLTIDKSIDAVLFVKNHGGIALAGAGFIATGGTAWAVWGVGATCDVWTAIANNDKSYAYGVFGIPPAKIYGSVWGLGNATYNTYGRNNNRDKNGSKRTYNNNFSLDSFFSIILLYFI